MTIKIGLIIAGLIVVGLVIYYFLNRQTTRAIAAATGGGDVDPITGQRWQTVSEAQAQINAMNSAQNTGDMIP